MSGLQASRSAALVCGLALFAATAACANRTSSVGWTDQLLANERSAYVARARDADAAARFASEAPLVLGSACEGYAAARVALLDSRIEQAELGLMASFEASAWQLQWEIRPWLGEPGLEALARQIAAADAAAASLAAQFATRPNDARLAARAATANAERSTLRSERSVAERDAALALARRIEALRETTRERIRAAYAPISEELRRAASAACRPIQAPDAAIAEARRAAYSDLHSAQVEGLAVLRTGHVDDSNDERAMAEAARQVLAAPARSTPPEWPIDPVFASTLSRVEQAIQSAERDGAARIDEAFAGLRAGDRPRR